MLLVLLWLLLLLVILQLLLLTRGNVICSQQQLIPAAPAAQVKLESLRFFEHGRSCTVWVEPEAEGGWAVSAPSPFPKLENHQA